MHFQLVPVVTYLTAVLYFSSQSPVTFANDTQSQPIKHGEVYRAKSQIDSLIYKLTLDFTALNEKKKDAENLARIAEEEMALLKPIQHLLEKLVKGNGSSGYKRCLANEAGKIPVRIETKESSLPQNYTISVPGTCEIGNNSLTSFIILGKSTFPTVTRGDCKQISYATAMLCFCEEGVFPTLFTLVYLQVEHRFLFTYFFFTEI